AGRRVGWGAMADPAAPRRRVLIFGDGELSARAADVSPILVEIAREARRIAHAPALAFEQEAVRIAVRRQGELEALRGQRRQIDDLQELMVLAPLIGLAFQRHFP